MKIPGQKTVIPYSETVDADDFQVNQIVSSPVPKVKAELPTGYIYIQFPNQLAPQDLWPGTEWTNVSSQFAGLFFRAEGGNASAFGNGTQSFATSVSGLSACLNSCYTCHNHGSATHCLSYCQSISGCNSSGCTRVCGNNNANEYTTICHTCSAGIHCHTVTLTSTDTETRPINYTVRVWSKV